MNNEQYADVVEHATTTIAGDRQELTEDEMKRITWLVAEIMAMRRAGATMNHKLTPHQQEIMQKIAEVPNISCGTLLYISRQAYPKYKRDFDSRLGIESPVWINGLGTSTHPLRTKHHFLTRYSLFYKLTETGLKYVEGLQS